MTFSAEEYGEDFVANNYCLAEIPDFQGLLPKAHQSEVPVFDLTDEDIAESGPVLAGMQLKRQMFNERFSEISEKLVNLLANA